MAVDNDFLKKVYDRYLGSDYEWGDADLNPKREIKKSSQEDWEENAAAIVERIKERVLALEAQASALPKYKAPEVVDNDNFVTESSGVAGGADPNPDINEQELAIKLAVGGSVDSTRIVLPEGDYTSTIDFLVNEIEKVILPILIPWTGNYDGPGISPSASIQMSNPGCDDVVDDDTIDLEDTNKEFKNLKDSSADADASSEEDSENEDDSSSTNQSSSKSTSEAADDKAADNETRAAQEVVERSKDIASCIAAEIGILQAILALLKVINVIKKAIILMMSIMVPIVKMIAFAAQCWINPPAASEVIQMIAEKIAALLVTAIGEILELIWRLLEMDCKTEMIQSVLDQINESLTGVNSVITVSKSLVSFTKNQTTAMAQSLEDSFNKFKQTSQWKDAWEDLKDSTTWESLKNTQKNAINEALFDNNGLSSAGLAAAASNTLPSNIKNSLNMLLNSSKDITNEANDMFSNMGLQDSALAQKLTDLTDFLGPLKIK